MKYESRHCTRPTDIMEELSVLSQTLQLDFWGLLLREGDEGKEGDEGDAEGREEIRIPYVLPNVEADRRVCF